MLEDDELEVSTSRQIQGLELPVYTHTFIPMEVVATIVARTERVRWRCEDIGGNCWLRRPGTSSRQPSNPS